MAVTAYVSTTLRVTAQNLIHSDDGSITAGATITVAVYDSESTLVSTASTSTSGSGDDWWIDITAPSTAGIYTIRVTVTYSGDEWTSVEELTVLALTTGSSFGRLPKSLGYIRREIGRELTDCIVLTATTGGASDSVFVDHNRLVAPDHAYKGRTAYVTAGTSANLLETRRVDDSSRTSTSITLTRALPATIQLGDEIEIWGKHDEGWMPWDVNDTINAVIADGADHFFVPIEATVDDAFDTDTRQIAIPSTITKGVLGLSYYDDDADLWYPIWERAAGPGMSGYWVNRGLGTIDIAGERWAADLDGLSIKIMGYGIPAPLEDDTDEVSINKEWVVRESIRRLLEQAWERKPEVVRQRLPGATRAAEIARQRALMRPAGSWVRV